MERSLFEKFSLFFFFFLFFLSSLGVSQDKFQEAFTLEDQPILTEADYLAYAFDENMILGTGNVKMSLGRLWIQADSLQLSINHRLVQAQGNVMIGTISETEEEKKDKKGGDFEESGEEVLEEKERKVLLKLRGDAVTFDLKTAQGSLYRVREEVEVIYFLGEDLRPLSTPLPAFTEKLEIPDLSVQAIAMVAHKMRLLIGSRLQAWKVTFYHRGMVVLRLPYYTTAAEEFVRDIPFHIRNLGYSSRQGSKVTVQYPYSTSLKTPGLLDISYQQKTRNQKKIQAHLQQHFNLFERTRIRFNSSNFTSKKRSNDLGLVHQLSKEAETQTFLRYSSSQPLSFNTLYLRRMPRAALVLGVEWSKNKGKSRDTRLSYQYSLFPEASGSYTPRILFSGFWGEDRENQKAYNQSMVVELIQQPWRLFPRLLADNQLRFQSSLGRISGIVQSQHFFSYRTSYVFTLSPSTQVVFAYNYSHQKSSEEKQFPVSFQHQSLFGRLSVGKQTAWGFLLQADYDLNKPGITRISPSYDLQFHPRWRVRLSTDYDPLSHPRLRVFNADWQYTFLGDKDRRFIQFLFTYDRILRKLEYAIEIPYLQ